MTNQREKIYHIGKRKLADTKCDKCGLTEDESMIHILAVVKQIVKETLRREIRNITEGL